MRVLANCRHSRWKLIGHRKRSTFTSFQSNLLSKHDVARHQGGCGHEAPPAFCSAIFANFLYVGGHPEMDAVLLASRRAAYVEISESVELIALLRRQPSPEQPNSTGFGPVLLPSEFKKPAKGANASRPFTRSVEQGTPLSAD
jgi:hypothetical protein